ncbi:MAG: BrnA antitoxin family protein [Burkholderiales bacterium]
MKRTSISRKSQSNWTRVRSLRDKDIVADRDAPEWNPEMFARAVVKKGLKTPSSKSLLSLRIDSEVLSWFRSQGPGYQSRMNALLRAYMEAHQK